MDVLEGILAFALVFLMLSMLATIAAEGVASAIGMRRGVLHAQVTRFCRDDLAALLRRYGVEPPEGVPDGLVGEILADGGGPGTLGQRIASLWKPFPEQLRHHLEAIEPDELAARMRMSAFGCSIESALGFRAESFYEEVAARFKGTEGLATGLYKRNSRATTMVAALILAVVLSADAFAILKTTMTDARVRQAIIASQEKILSTYAAQPGTASAELKQALDEQVAGLRGAGFQFGIWRCSGDQPPPLCFNAPGRSFLMWVLGVLATGLLAGLGAPFWYDTARGLADTVNRLRGRDRQPHAGGPRPDRAQG